ncbi:MAG: helix-turn-helix domain-containing protein [Pseudomonadales bacterium]|nr:helix-turn-helix domain-containing protein [Pseudomonadales bacterium]
MFERWSANEVSPEYLLQSLKQSIERPFCLTEVGVLGAKKNCAIEIQSAPLGNISILQYRATGTQTAKRNMVHIRTDHADDYLLYLPISACVDVEQSGRCARISPGDFAFIHTGKPFSAKVISDTGSVGRLYENITVRIPASLLREKAPKLDNNCNRVFTLNPGASRIMATSVISVFSETAALRDGQLEKMGRILIEIIGLATAEALGLANNDSMTLNLRNRSYEKVINFIEAHLSDSKLSTLHIADSCGISLRYLHLLFETRGVTVASLIREMRLQKCRTALCSAGDAYQSISEIAFAWGFNDTSHFSRLYKKRFGCTPREHWKKSIS